MRVLFVHCSPHDEDALRVAGELRVARQAVERGPRTIIVEDLPSATIEDLRTKLLRAARSFDVIHFAGHASEDALVFEDEGGASTPVALTAVGELLGRDKTRCIILNACNSLQKMTASIAAVTIGVSDTVNDDDAVPTGIILLNLSFVSWIAFVSASESHSLCA
jgi:CHAT domain